MRGDKEEHDVNGKPKLRIANSTDIGMGRLCSVDVMKIANACCCVLNNGDGNHLDGLRGSILREIRVASPATQLVLSTLETRTRSPLHM